MLRWTAATDRRRGASGNKPCRRSSMRGDEPRAFQSELEACFAGSVGQGLDPAVVTVARTVEGDLFDASGHSTFGDHLAHSGSSIAVLAVLQAFLDVGLQRIGRGDDLGAV